MSQDHSIAAAMAAVNTQPTPHQYSMVPAPDYYYQPQQPLVIDTSHEAYLPQDVYQPSPQQAPQLPPIDGLPRHHSYFNIPTVSSSPGLVDPMSAHQMALSYPPPAHGNLLMRVPQHQPYPSPMMLGRFNLGIADDPTPPPISSSLSNPQLDTQPLVTPATTSRSTPRMPRINSQSSTSQRKRYLCTVCKKMFARPSTLATHLHSHTGEKPFECTWDGCGKRFSVMSNLRRHQRIHERQREKFASMQPTAAAATTTQPAKRTKKKKQAESDDESTSGSNTPLAAQMNSMPPIQYQPRQQLPPLTGQGMMSIPVLPSYSSFDTGGGGGGLPGVHSLPVFSQYPQQQEGVMPLPDMLSKHQDQSQQTSASNTLNPCTPQSTAAPQTVITE